MEPESRGKIIVVDDEGDVGRLLQSWLQQDGYDVSYAEGFDALRPRFAEAVPDLITLDVMMPRVGGIEVLEWVRENHPHVGVVMATAVGNLETVIGALRKGAVNYMLKPFNLNLVSEEIAKAMERQRMAAELRAYQAELEARVEEQTRDLRCAHQQLQRHVRELEGRDRLVQFQLGDPDSDEALVEITEVVQQVLDGRASAIYRRQDGNLNEARLRMAALTGDVQAMGPLERSDLIERALRLRQPQRDSRSLLAAVPLYHQDEALGVLVAALSHERDRREAENTLWRLGKEASLLLWNVIVARDLDRGTVDVEGLIRLGTEAE